jgi:hypothetical protein
MRSAWSWILNDLLRHPNIADEARQLAYLREQRADREHLARLARERAGRRTP